MENMSDQILSLAAQIVSAHVTHNAVPAEGLPALIQSVYSTLSRVDSPVVEAEKLQPAVPVKKSVFPDYVVCLEDGKKLKMLKRHLQTHYSLTPEQYREKWGLPYDYPMVAPNYAEKRSALAKSIGLGRKPAATTEEEPEASAPVRRGRKKGG
jgi:predicted transcriptional regulator